MERQGHGCPGRPRRIFPLIREETIGGPSPFREPVALERGETLDLELN